MKKFDRTNEKKSNCSTNTSNSADNEEQRQENCQSSKRLRFYEKKFNNLLCYLHQIKI